MSTFDFLNLFHLFSTDSERSTNEIRPLKTAARPRPLEQYRPKLYNKRNQRPSLAATTAHKGHGELQQIRVLQVPKAVPELGSQEKVWGSKGVSKVQTSASQMQTFWSRGHPKNGSQGQSVQTASFFQTFEG